MTANIDEIFQKSGVPTKRKLDALQDPREAYRSTKPYPGTHQADNDNTVASGPSAPPDQSESLSDDDEGRFFGGGLTKAEAEVIDYVSGQKDDTKPLKIDIGWLRKTAQNVEKRIGKNAELRSKFEGEPQKFIESEADLDAEIRGLSILADYPGLYAEFVRLNCAGQLVGLLAHENTDIAITAAEVIEDLTGEETQVTDEQWNSLVDAMLEADLVDLLLSNLMRLNEEDEEDEKGVYKCVAVLEGLCSRRATSEQLGRNKQLLKWLLERAQKKEQPVSQNKQYAAEILAILSQQSPDNRRALTALDAVDMFLQLVASFRKRDPEQGGDEEEYMNDLFETLTCLVDESEGKSKFLEAEGIELCLIMLKEGKASKAPALRLLDHATASTAAAGAAAAACEVCQKLVEAGGLKTTFTMFMKRNDSKTLQHLLAMFSSMLRLLPANSAERIRTLAKFVEKEYEKVGRLIKLRRDFGARVREEEKRVQAELSELGPDEEEARVRLESELEVRRLDAGMFCQNMVDVILAWLVAEDDGARQWIRDNLNELTGQNLSVIKTSLETQVEALDRDEEESKELREVLSALIECLG